MNIIDLAQCACAEINGLAYHHQGREAMREFCRIAWSGKEVSTKWPTASKGAMKLSSFYLFTAAANGIDGYGGNFAKFIKEHKLGEVVETPAVINAKFHPDHRNKAWIWTPDVPALDKWWQAEKAVIQQEAMEDELKQKAMMEAYQKRVEEKLAAAQAVQAPVGGADAGNVESR